MTMAEVQFYWSPCQPDMALDDRGGWVARTDFERITADHEAALAAKDARIAEIERIANFHLDAQNNAAKGRMRAELDLETLRTAIEKLADKTFEQAKLGNAERRRALDYFAYELRALLGEGK